MLRDNDQESEQALLYESEGLRQQERRLRVLTYLRSYMAMGAIISLASAGYLALSFLQPDLTRPQLLALVAALSGMGVLTTAAAASYLVLQATRESRHVNVHRDAALLLSETWYRFETIARSIINPDQYPNSQTLRAIMVQLKRKRLIDDAEVEDLRSALELRNVLIHGSTPPEQISPHRLYEAAFAVRRILRKLEKEHDQDA